MGFKHRFFIFKRTFTEKQIFGAKSYFTALKLKFEVNTLLKLKNMFRGPFFQARFLVQESKFLFKFRPKKENLFLSSLLFFSIQFRRVCTFKFQLSMKLACVFHDANWGLVGVFAFSFQNGLQIQAKFCFSYQLRKPQHNICSGAGKFLFYSNLKFIITLTLDSTDFPFDFAGFHFFINLRTLIAS